VSYLENITHYFRKSLIDSERLSPSDKDILPALAPNQNTKNDYISLHNALWKEGEISDPNTLNKILGSKSQKEVLLFPRVDLLKQQAGQYTSQMRRVLLPLAVLVIVNKDGTLQPSKTPPWIPRQWISPNSDGDSITEMDTIDAYFTSNPYETVQNWGDLIKYCHGLLSYIVKAETNTNNIYEISLFDDYQTTANTLLQCEAPSLGVSTHIIKALDILLKNQEYPSLYRRYCSRTSPATTPFHSLIQDSSLAKKHVGQMTGEFPLAPNQRNAFHHFLNQNTHDILAVNGPPGTGKTTLLRSVVANLWTEYAIAESEPPLIVATSNNNQAVTNILDSFAKVDEHGLESSLQGRWLPEVASYGLYFCSQSKANGSNPFLYVAGDKGCMQAWQSKESLKNFTDSFLNKSMSWKKEADSIEKAKVCLHKSMLETKSNIEQGITLLDNFLATEQSIQNQYGSINALKESIKDFQKRITEIQFNIKETNTIANTFVEQWDKRSVFIKLFMWLPLIHKNEHWKNKQLLRQHNIELTGSSDADIETYMDQEIRTLRSSLKTNQLTFSQQINLENKYQNTSSSLTTWLARA